MVDFVEHGAPGYQRNLTANCVCREDVEVAVITPAGSATVTIVPGSAEETDGQTIGITAAPDGNMYLPININRQVGAVGYVVKVIP